MTKIEILPVEGARLLDAFIRLPERLHSDDPNYIAPLHTERKDALTNKNPFFGHADVQFWLARRAGRFVGRITAQIDHQALSLRPDAAGQFGMIAAEDDPAIFAALLDTAADWLRARGMKRMQGPFNLNINEEIGLLIDGFDTPPMLLMGPRQTLCRRPPGRTGAEEGKRRLRLYLRHHDRPSGQCQTPAEPAFARGHHGPSAGLQALQ